MLDKAPLSASQRAAELRHAGRRSAQVRVRLDSLPNNQKNHVKSSFLPKIWNHPSTKRPIDFTEKPLLCPQKGQTVLADVSSMVSNRNQLHLFFILFLKLCVEMIQFFDPFVIYLLHKSVITSSGVFIVVTCCFQKRVGDRDTD